MITQLVIDLDGALVDQFPQWMDDGDNTHFPIERFAELLAVTGDLRPVHWLCERFLQDTPARQAQDLAQLRALVPQVARVLARLDGGASR